MELREHNIEILNSLRKTIEDYKLSNPLLVFSNKKYIENLKKQKRIMYIGQETNGWELKDNIDSIEECYLKFLYNGASNREFWRFLKLIRNKEEISLENLKFLYNLLKPDMIIMVTGPNNPYYEIIQEFLKHLNSSLVNLYPTTKDMLLIDETKNIHYTYHPNYLNRRGKLLELSKTINSYYKK